MSDNVNDLTRPKKTRKDVVITEAVVAPVTQIVEPIVPKVKKPRTQAQIDAFQRSAAIRQANVAKTRELKALAKAQGVIEKSQNKQVPVQQNNIQEQPIDSSSDESDIEIVLKRKPKPKPKKKAKYTVVITDSEDSESDSESEYESEYEPEPKPIVPRKTRNFATQQNKKSILKVHNPSSTNYDHYFGE